MGRKKAKKGGGGGRSSKLRDSKQSNKISSVSTTTTTVQQHASYTNFVPEAGPGCYIARRDAKKVPSWLIEWEDVDPKEFRDGDKLSDESEDEHQIVPDVAIDTEEQTLSVCNIHDCHKVAYVSVYDIPVFGADGIQLQAGSTTDNEGKTSSCITLIVLVPPRVFVHLCYLDVPPDIEDVTKLRIESDVSPWTQHPNPSDEHSFRIGFPLGKRPQSEDAMIGTTMDSSSLPPSFLCTQGENGELTHFFSGNFHAIDFQCPVGTELLAVADGVVVDVKENNTLTGIAVTNLYEWNSILLQICTCEDRRVDNVPIHPDGPLFVEYVHIKKSLVKTGDSVKKHQVIGCSGSVGFSPEPHLHFSAFRSSEPTAPTVRVLFDGNDDVSKDVTKVRPTLLPVAGQRYNSRRMELE
jgi:murein DD-endopeptidase MepM/ murein hydrolase activator NlpD